MKAIFLAASFALIAGTALAGEADFAKLDADSSGALSLAELNAVMDDFTAQDLAAIDTDKSGDLSEAEYAAWKAAKAKKNPAKPQ